MTSCNKPCCNIPDVSCRRYDCRTCFINPYRHAPVILIYFRIQYPKGSIRPFKIKNTFRQGIYGIPIKREIRICDIINKLFPPIVTQINNCPIYPSRIISISIVKRCN